MSQVDLLLQKLDKVKQTEHGRWVACCPAHEDKSPSLRIREVQNAEGEDIVLLHCFAGCSADEITGAVGLNLSDLFPPKPKTDEKKQSRLRPFMPPDVFELLLSETRLVYLMASDIRKGREISDKDMARFEKTLAVLNDIQTTCYRQATQKFTPKLNDKKTPGETQDGEFVPGVMR